MATSDEKRILRLLGVLEKDVDRVKSENDRLHAELAAEREKAEQTLRHRCVCVFADKENPHPIEECKYHGDVRKRAERAEAACAARTDALEDAARELKICRAHMVPPLQPEIRRSVEEALSLCQSALSTDAGRAYAEQRERYRKALQDIACSMLRPSDGVAECRKIIAELEWKAREALKEKPHD